MVGRPRVTATTTGDSSDKDSASESGGESHGNTSRKRHTSPAAGSVEERLPLSERRVLTSLTPDRPLLSIIPVRRYGSFSSLLLLLLFRKNLNASKPSEHPPQVEECLKV